MVDSLGGDNIQCALSVCSGLQMVQEFEDLGGSSFSNPSLFRRWASSLMIRRLSGANRRERR